MNAINKAFFSILISISIGLNAQNRSINIVSQNKSSIILDFTLPNYSVIDTVLNPYYNVNQTFSYIKIDNIDFGIIDSVGWPQIPQLTFNVCLPYNATNITASFVSTGDDSFISPHQIMPRQEEILKDTLVVYNFVMDATCYNSSSWIYSDKVIITDEYNVFGAKGVPVTVCPFSYNPSNSLVNVCLSGRITINFTLDDRIIETPRRFTEVTEHYLNNFFVNYTIRSTNLSKERYLMIVDSAYLSTLYSFANYKINSGYEVFIATTQETGSAAASIQSYIQGFYNNTNTRPEYVLLVGDVNTIPASAGDGSGNSQNDPITDLHYSRLDGIDYYSDVFLGRFPITSNYQLQNIIDKTIYMETNMSSFVNRVYLIAGDSNKNIFVDWWWRRQFEKAHEYVVSHTFNPLGFDWYKHYQPNNSAVSQALSNDPKYFIYSGHGGIYGWFGESFTLNSNMIYSASNTIYPFVFAFACNTGNYYQDECIGETWIKAPETGSVTYFGSSIETCNHPDQVIEKKMFYNNFQNQTNIAAIVNNGKNGYWDSFWATLNDARRYRYMKSYNLLGDPSLNVNGTNDCFVNYIFYYPESYTYGQIKEYDANTEIRNESNYTMNSGSDVVWEAGEVIQLKPGFHAKTGSHFVAAISSCDRNRDYAFDNNVSNIDNQETIDEVLITISNKDFYVYPNPTINEIVLSYTMECDDNVYISILNMNGEVFPLFSGGKSQGFYSERYSLTNLPSGIYVISIKTSQYNYLKKIIKQ